MKYRLLFGLKWLKNCGEFTEREHRRLPRTSLLVKKKKKKDEYKTI